ncbi:UNVERIFIED_CONTAM: Iridoid oxidase [Sesamum angustifolium]|uniref:Iridoid oxidase n=1 Tax=Sesamum angustifolium TaxID=2727405 RepID=A0AAW2MP65_9LAMI
MFFGGTETTSSTIEWGMSELLRNPDAMKKLQDEVDRIVGRGRKLEESDLNNMPYLQATVKEILRLHPVFPMLLPRNSMQDTEFMGYVVPKNTQIFVNAWAIHRDPASWSDPLSFKPERFLGSDIDYKGQNFELLPFGSGRRTCIGLALGHRMVSLTLASLVQAFDWKVISPQTLDMGKRLA